MNGQIGKQMVDTLVESSANFEMILKFFDIFLKMKDLTTSEAFMVSEHTGDVVVAGRASGKRSAIIKWLGCSRYWKQLCSILSMHSFIAIFAHAVKELLDT